MTVWGRRHALKGSGALALTCILLSARIAAAQPAPQADGATPPSPPKEVAPGPEAAEELLLLPIKAAAMALASMHFYSQMQAGVATTLVNGYEPGGIGLVASQNMFGFGLVAAVRYERDPIEPDEAVREGAMGSAAFELRPLGLARSRLHQFIDPHASVGLAMGAAAEQFRAALELGVGVDVGLIPWLEMHPALTLQYRLRPLQHPSDYALHHIQVGTAWRAAF